MRYGDGPSGWLSGRRAAKGLELMASRPPRPGQPAQPQRLAAIIDALAEQVAQLEQRIERLERAASKQTAVITYTPQKRGRCTW